MKPDVEVKHIETIVFNLDQGEWLNL